GSPPRRAGGGDEHARGGGVDGTDPTAARHLRSLGRARRAQHAGRDGGLRRDPGARPRRDDRARDPRRDPDEPRRPRRVSRRRGERVTSIRVAHPTRPPRGTAGSETLLSVEDVRVSYGAIAALKGVTLQVGRGEIVALLGANGAGKTTTLKSVVRLLPLASGRGMYDGRDVSGVPVEEVVRAGVSLVPEGRAIFAGLTVRENLELGAYPHRDPAAMGETFEDVVA